MNAPGLAGNKKQKQQIEATLQLTLAPRLPKMVIVTAMLELGWS
jgi:hypothetical protein